MKERKAPKAQGRKDFGCRFRPPGRWTATFERWLLAFLARRPGLNPRSRGVTGANDEAGHALHARHVPSSAIPGPGAGIRIGPEGGEAVMFLLSADAAAGIGSRLMRVDSPVESIQVLRPLYPLPSNQS